MVCFTTKNTTRLLRFANVKLFAPRRERERVIERENSLKNEMFAISMRSFLQIFSHNCLTICVEFAQRQIERNEAKFGQFFCAKGIPAKVVRLVPCITCLPRSLSLSNSLSLSMSLEVPSLPCLMLTAFSSMIPI